MVNPTTMLALAAGLMASLSVAAENPRRDDFAYGFNVKTTGQSVLWRLTVPDDVYRHATRPGLGDVRVFDRNGVVVAHTLRHPRAVAGKAPPPVVLPLFPLKTTRIETEIGRALRIITDASGRIVDTQSETVSSGDSEYIAAYLLDASRLKQPPNKLVLSWEHDGRAGFTAVVSVEYSEDLSQWVELVSQATIADLRSGKKHAIKNQEIGLPQRAAKYLRITWPKVLRGVSLTRVTAFFPRSRIPLKRRWTEVVGIANPEQAGIYEFDTGGFWPSDRVRVTFPAGNIVVQGVLMSQPDPESTWHVRFRGSFYELRHGKATVAREPFDVAQTSDRYWRLEVGDDGGRLRKNPPVLELGWLAHELTFAAQGEPPYTLAYGSATIGPSEQSIDVLLAAIDDEQIKTARLGEKLTLGGEIRLTPPPAPFPWKRYLLWASLLLGVVLLAWMVRRLFGQLAASNDDGSEK